MVRGECDDEGDGGDRASQVLGTRMVRHLESRNEQRVNAPEFVAPPVTENPVDDGLARATARGEAAGVHAPDDGDFFARASVVRRAATGKQTRERTRIESTAFARTAGNPAQASPRGGCKFRGRRERTGDTRHALTNEDDRSGLSQCGERVGSLLPTHQSTQGDGLAAGLDGPPFGVHLVHAARAHGGQGDDAGTALARGSAQAQEDNRRLVLGLQADEQDGGGLVEIGVRRPERLAGYRRCKELRLFVASDARAEVNVPGAHGHSRELRVGVGILTREAPTGEDSRSTAGGCQAARRDIERFGPRGRA